MSKSASGCGDWRSISPLAVVVALPIPTDSLGQMIRDLTWGVQIFPMQMRPDVVRAEVHDEELVLVSVEDFLGGGVETGDFGAGEDAKEDGELDVLAVVHEEVEEFGSAFVACFV
jgi:hypothetical protein